MQVNKLPFPKFWNRHDTAVDCQLRIGGIRKRFTGKKRGIIIQIMEIK